MAVFLKKPIKIFLMIVLLVVATYGGYKLYLFIIEDATQRIQQGVAKGVRRGVLGVFNPFKW